MARDTLHYPPFLESTSYRPERVFRDRHCSLLRIGHLGEDAPLPTGQLTSRHIVDGSHNTHPLLLRRHHPDRKRVSRQALLTLEDWSLGRGCSAAHRTARFVGTDYWPDSREIGGALSIRIWFRCEGIVAN
ncbi:hypothetical protein CEXT_599331 [Caerostris extrusa]|uniref:Uncharacterized protein n=1 Tax=Caerostris extrusa TaxID=172846 RepID=A0AAV4P471_CAEEX|nr:hypothetical protein CEXT_599331 [Caerostris extrusa]